MRRQAGGPAADEDDRPGAVDDIGKAAGADEVEQALAPSGGIDITGALDLEEAQDGGIEFFLIEPELLRQPLLQFSHSLSAPARVLVPL